jgi:hypothetical protein
MSSSVCTSAMKAFVLSHTQCLHASKILMLNHVSSTLFCIVPGKATYTLYLLSNSHIGLDQQFELCFSVSPVRRSETAHAR